MDRDLAGFDAHFRIIQRYYCHSVAQFRQMMGQLVHVLFYPTDFRRVIVDDEGDVLLAVGH